MVGNFSLESQVDGFSEEARAMRKKNKFADHHDFWSELSFQDDDHYNELENASERDFNDLVVLLLADPSMERASRLTDFVFTARNLLYPLLGIGVPIPDRCNPFRDDHPEYVYECVYLGIEYFVKTYLPGSSGETPKLQLRNQQQAFSLLLRKTKNLIKDYSRTQSNRRELLTRIFKRRGNVVEPIDIILNEDDEPLRKAVKRAIETKTGYLLTDVPAFSGKDKEMAFESFFFSVMVNKEMTKENWLEECLPQFCASAGVDSKSREIRDAFIGYFRKKERRLKAKIIKTCTTKIGHRTIVLGVYELGRRKARGRQDACTNRIMYKSDSEMLH